MSDAEQRQLTVGTVINAFEPPLIRTGRVRRIFDKVAISWSAYQFYSLHILLNLFISRVVAFTRKGTFSSASVHSSAPNCPYKLSALPSAGLVRAYWILGSRLGDLVGLAPSRISATTERARRLG